MALNIRTVIYCPINFHYNDGGRARYFSGTGGDCVTRAIAIASGRDYIEVYNALAEGNARQRKGKRPSRNHGKRTALHGINVRRKWFKDLMQEWGFEWVPTMGIGQGCKVHLRACELPLGRLVVSLSKHYTAVIDRQLHDLYDCSREGTRCVYGYWKYIK